MKKFSKILCAAALLLYGFMITGCGAAEAIKEQLEGTYNQWYKYKSTVKIPLGSTDEENASEAHELKAAEIYVIYKKDTGLKVAVQTTSQQDIEMLGGLVTTTQDVYIGGTQEYDTNTVTTARWSALLLTGNFVKADEPEIVSGTGTCIILAGEDKTDFKIQWKKFLKNYLIGNLLEV